MSGGGGGGQVDKAYNARMATIAEKQQAMADEYFQYYKSGPGHWETQTASGATTGTPAASTPAVSAGGLSGFNLSDTDALLLNTIGGEGNRGTSTGNTFTTGAASALKSSAPATSQVWVPDEGGVSYQQMEQAQMKANMELIPKQTGLQSALLDNTMKVLPKYYDEALNGVNVGERVSLAAADVENAYAGADKSLRRSASAMGLNPASARYMSTAKDLYRDKAAARVGATSLARRQAEEENFARLSGAMGLASV